MTFFKNVKWCNGMFLPIAIVAMIVFTNFTWYNGMIYQCQLVQWHSFTNCDQFSLLGDQLVDLPVVAG